MLSLLHRGRIVIVVQRDCGPVATLHYRNNCRRWAEATFRCRNRDRQWTTVAADLSELLSKSAHSRRQLFSHRSLACRLIAVRCASDFAIVAAGPHPRAVLRRDWHLEDAADDAAVFVTS
jgi:hypothetical protein